MNEYSRVSLLETIMVDSGCRSLKELAAIPKEKRAEIASHIICDIPQDVPTLQDYNEALHYLLCVGPANTKEEARSFLLDGLHKKAEGKA